MFQDYPDIMSVPQVAQALASASIRHITWSKHTKSDAGESDVKFSFPRSV